MAPATGRGVEKEEDFLGFSVLSKCGNKKNPPKRKRVNRNKKKNWKKHSDVRDVEEFMDDVRLQERTAGGLLSEKANENLYFVDTGKNKAARKRKLKKRTKPLRIDLILQPDSKVPPPKDISSHQVLNGKKLKRKRERERKLEKKGILPRADRLLLALQDRPSSTHKDEANTNPSRGFYDLWTANNPLDSALEGKDQWYLEQTKRSRVKESRLQELCEGLVEESDEDQPAGGEAEHDDQMGRSLHQRERKTERQRKKEKEAKILRAGQEAERRERLRRQSLFQLKSIQASLKSRQDELLRRKKLREEKRKAEALQPKRLGRLKYQEPDLDVLLSEELTESLRKLKPEGSVIKDRFKSFQKRNLIEPRERAKFKRKLKVKYVEKRAFKEISV
ncbi:hypothetical protein GDO78_013280 [Eleutherodactylus coqui]|uniref:Ribosome biogenesis protein NOP53 n=1 Tax=Eleutherodactylus coqui TaxID=57060 RepID=A0A8J6K7D1_ELECQ|nr:hypothetical protein GDO78_013280 [Eleutherodactylus coqui]